jgi:hypothetical protein
MRDQVLAVHADAVVGHGQGLRRLVERDRDLELRIVGEQAGLGQAEVAQFVARVGRIGDELTQEDGAVAVERVRDDIQEPRYLGLKPELFHFHGLNTSGRRKSAP